MGHRALVAYERPDGQYNLHYSHWGGLNMRLKRRISVATPFGSTAPTAPWSQELFEDLVTDPIESPTETSAEMDNRPSLDVDPTPIAESVTFENAITEHLDYLHHEAFYKVSTAFEVTAYRTLWFGLQYESAVVEQSPTVGNGALCTVRWYEGEPVGDGRLRGAFEGMKDVVGDLLDRGAFSRDEAIQYLRRKVVARAGSQASLLIRTPEEPE